MDEELSNFWPNLEAEVIKQLQKKVAELGLESIQIGESAPPELTQLHEAISEKSLKKVNALIRSDLDVNQCHSNFDLGFPLKHALEVGDSKIIRTLLKAGANPNVADYLATSIEDDKLPLAKALIEHGADLNGQPTWEKDEEFETNLIRATRLGKLVSEPRAPEGAAQDWPVGLQDSAVLGRGSCRIESCSGS